MKEVKTNAMRILDSLGIEYKHISYECDEFVSGIQVADMLGLPRERVFKTLVTTAGPNKFYVFVIPIENEIDLKKAAKSVGEKSLAMIHVKDIKNITGYVRGGCTSIGMKKQFVTRVQEDAMLYDYIYVSGGRIGSQLCLAPEDLLKAASAEYGDIVS